jgi:hypothetical protein
MKRGWTIKGNSGEGLKDEESYRESLNILRFLKQL